MGEDFAHTKNRANNLGKLALCQLSVMCSMRWLREEIGCNASKARKGRAREGEPAR